MSTTTTQTTESVPSTLKVESKHHEGFEQVAEGVSNITFGGDDLAYPYRKPEFKDKYEERKWVLEHTAAAFRYLARFNYQEGASGHISVRDPVDPHTFWINPLGRHFGLMRAKDLVHINEKGEVIGGNKHVVNAAGFQIHSEIHQARPDVNAAVHSHSIYGKAYSAFGKPLEMLNQDSTLFYKSHTVYNTFGGVVFENEEGKRLAKALGDNRCIILQNHGLLTTGSTVDEAAYLFGLMERTCQVQMIADQHPETKILIDEEEATYTAHMIADPESVHAEFAPEYEWELETSNGAFLFKDESYKTDAFW
ncbi:hypothetical protein BN7_1442 [Wickerhamomyces ciferrii]|uniref:Class II aldolase/adducin N-terminal domain-containing protein n=1 Tax=Wickerhamomyces ciferrii (strain ATCC 14091 / BCRC 22168 / CBS 111 / JCM 3599 / NBRC 0793 / NRRL Y-1031 F-60-10) TaxID=1206466 RepID=K0KLB5_WICCF|nr:uncharacterized protein BN7_1442 [Wickerhamomyces ciferrii]CCH41903.1 hypothetical protein BN7_1442 [Wickerhamomyces ciferrii]